MPDLINAGLSWVFIGLLVLALWWAVRALDRQTSADDAELYTYRPARRTWLERREERPRKCWDHFHDDYE